MQLHRFENPKDFQIHTQAYLRQHEAAHNLLLGIQHNLVQWPQAFDPRPYLVAVEQNAEVKAVALRTSPWPLVLSKMTDWAVLEAIALDLFQADATLPGVSGLVAETEVFTQIWQTLTCQTPIMHMQMWIHQLQQVQPVIQAAGYLRLAKMRDRDLLVQWYQDFEAEACHDTSRISPTVIEQKIQQGGLYLWEDGVPVSMAGGQHSTLAGGRIGPVYTPPEYRQRGYATACVAALSQTLLDQGCRSCFLFTDQANPTSNHIYRKIGYQRMCDWTDYRFGSATKGA